MGLTTTCIGAYPKPDYVTLPDWFQNLDTQDPTSGWAEALETMGDEASVILEKGTREAVMDQVDAGIDIPTDGEIARENYIHYHCRHLENIDFIQLTERQVRTGNYSAKLPTVRGPVKSRDLFLTNDWMRAQKVTDQPVKITMPGPLTVADTLVDNFYGDLKIFGRDVAAALNQEVMQLAEAGCKHIQIDEPLFARYPEKALEFGIENLERAFHNCPADVTRVVHMCCGYPDRIDVEDYPKAPLDSYWKIAKTLDESTVMVVSIEDAHQHNNLKLLEEFRKTTVMLGVVAIAKSRIESAEEIQIRLKKALEHIEPSRLMAAPDCGLGILGRELSLKKLRHLSEAAKSLT